jgi:hypothetical protein
MMIDLFQTDCSIKRRQPIGRVSLLVDKRVFVFKNTSDMHVMTNVDVVEHVECEDLGTYEYCT